MNTDSLASPVTANPDGSGSFDIKPRDPAAFDAMPYDECIARLARAIDRNDDADLGEMAGLIGRLAVVIEI